MYFRKLSTIRSARETNSTGVMGASIELWHFLSDQYELLSDLEDSNGKDKNTVDLHISISPAHNVKLNISIGNLGDQKETNEIYISNSAGEVVIKAKREHSPEAAGDSQPKPRCTLEFPLGFDKAQEALIALSVEMYSSLDKDKQNQPFPWTINNCVDEEQAKEFLNAYDAAKKQIPNLTLSFPENTNAWLKNCSRETLDRIDAAKPQDTDKKKRLHS